MEQEFYKHNTQKKMKTYHITSMQAIKEKMY